MPAALYLIPEITKLAFPKGQGELSSFIDAYIDALVWSTSITLEEDSEPVEADQFDLSTEAREEMTQDCINFLKVAGRDIHQATEQYSFYSWGQAGHDFALTRNGHGAGYWDRGLDKLGDTLSDHAKNEGSVDLYVVDGELYQQ